MNFSRRDFGKFALASVPAAGALLSGSSLLAAQDRDAGPGIASGARKPESVFAGVLIGVIVPYSYHNEPSDAKAILDDMLFDGLQACEMMSQTAEPYAGAPAMPNPFAGRGRRGPGRPGPGGPGGRRGPGRFQMTPAMQAARAKAQAAMTRWRLSVPMSRYEALRRMYNDAGVNIYGFKLQLDMTMPDAEFDYAFHVVKALGADQLTMEHPSGADANELTDRIGQFATKYKIMVGYHAHTQASPTLWNTAMSQSAYNGINLDVGHYVAAGNHDVLAFVSKNHARITSMHLKDRCYPNHNNGSNELWGQGDTPLVALLHMMRDGHYGFPGAIELEYAIPAGSNANIEVARCLAYAKNALLT